MDTDTLVTYKDWQNTYNMSVFRRELLSHLEWVWDTTTRSMRCLFCKNTISETHKDDCHMKLGMWQTAIPDDFLDRLNTGAYYDHWSETPTVYKIQTEE